MSKLSHIERGLRFGRLVVSAEAEDYVAPSGKRKPRSICTCDCGRTKVVLDAHLKKGSVKSCGCYRSENPSARSHGMSDHPLYATWRGIIRRCYTKSSRGYRWYGAKGVEIHHEWRHRPELFIEWVVANIGDRPGGMTIDRIDTSGHYEPGNLRWASAEDQNNNRTDNVYVGDLTIAQHCRQTGESANALYLRRFKKLRQRAST